MESRIQGDISNKEYDTSENDVNDIIDMFSIGDIEDEWRFIKINFTEKEIYFQNIENAKINSNDYIASFTPIYATYANNYAFFLIIKM